MRKGTQHQKLKSEKNKVVSTCLKKKKSFKKHSYCQKKKKKSPVVLPNEVIILIIYLKRQEGHTSRSLQVVKTH